MKALTKTNATRAILHMIQEHGFTQKEIAKRAKVSAGCIHKVLNGGNPHLTTLAKIRRLAQDLGEAEVAPTPPTPSKNMEVFKGVGDDGRAFQIILIRE